MYIGIDLGGSHIGFGLLDESFKLIKKEKVLITRQTEVEQIIYLLKEGIQKFFDKSVRYIGIGFPGICDIKKRIVTRASNINFSSICIPEILEKEFNVPVYLDNDANCATIAEYFKGNLQGINNGVLITVGTGIGGGIILNKELYRGSNYTAGEFGHTTFVKDGITCGCGKKGCFEKYASISSLKKKCLQKGYNFEICEEIFNSSDKDVIKIKNEWMNNLAEGISNIYNILDIEKIVVGGGFSKSFYLIEKDLRNLVKEKIYNKNKEIIIQKAMLENSAGIIGAGMLGSIK
ncbi:MAG: ROK family protein [Clostridiales bacterium]|nr:ROK family protein [Clostridiales bacterium]